MAPTNEVSSMVDMSSGFFHAFSLFQLHSAMPETGSESKGIPCDVVQRRKFGEGYGVWAQLFW